MCIRDRSSLHLKELGCVELGPFTVPDMSLELLYYRAAFWMKVCQLLQVLCQLRLHLFEIQLPTVICVLYPFCLTGFDSNVLVTATVPTVAPWRVAVAAA